VWGSGFKVLDFRSMGFIGIRILVSEFGFQGSGFRVQGLAFDV